LGSFDFLGILERLEESLVVFDDATKSQKMADILYLSAKGRGV
jgi:hypothetical protein